MLVEIQISIKCSVQEYKTRKGIASENDAGQHSEKNL